jgi:transposase InsO family protein
MPSSACRRSYDHRLRNLVYEEYDPSLFNDLGVPRSTIASWIRRGPRPVVSAEILALDQMELQAEVISLQRRIRFLLAIIRLAFMLVRLSGFRLDSHRLPDGKSKNAVLRAVTAAKKAMPTAVALRVLGLSASRFHNWRNLAQACPLQDRTSCPRSTPTQLTAFEVNVIGDMVTHQDHRHMPLRTLALYAQRIGKVFAAPATWARLVRERGWLRPRRRLYPAEPKEGIRATKPNEYWHLDVTVIKLLDGTRTYLHAVIDNFSRRILAWNLTLRLEPQTTCQVLVEAAKNLPADSQTATVVADSGVENVNRAVDDLLGLGQLRRVLAQVEVSFSNSMIEAWWRSLKHGWLYLHQLDTFAALERLVAFYVEQHNTVLPHAAFAGQTPDEMYFGRGERVPGDLAAARAHARESRMKANRSLTCAACRVLAEAPPDTPDSLAISDLLQLRPEESRMS